MSIEYCAIGSRRLSRVWVVALCCGALLCPGAGLPAWAAQSLDAPPSGPATLLDAQRLFYNARYAEAAELTRGLPEADSNELATIELRTSAVLFQLKALLEPKSGRVAVKNCAVCPSLIDEFLVDFQRGRAQARQQLIVDPGDDTARFFLGKLSLNYVWLQLGPLKKKTGWDEYWEARKSLDAVLKSSPNFVRARVARAWIDYIVDTRMPWGTEWLLGGGDRKRALASLREAAPMPADFFTHAEAEFALWDMHIRERDTAAAFEVASRLARDFPENPDVAAFLHDREAHLDRR